MANERVVKSEEGKKLADEIGKFFSFRYIYFIWNSREVKDVIMIDFLGLEFFETSAKENINVKSVFER